MLWQIENVWTSRNRFGNLRSMLVLDSFRDHTVNSVRNQKNTNIAVIPGGCTSKLQPLDVAINKSFKSKVILFDFFTLVLILVQLLIFVKLQVKDQYNDWMISNIHTFTPMKKIKRPSYSTVATWVKESWNEVSKDLIQRSFKTCGISTNIDGSENDCIFDDVLDDRDDEMVEISDDENHEEYFKNK